MVEVVALADPDAERLTRPRPVTKKSMIPIPRPRLVGLGQSSSAFELCLVNGGEHAAALEHNPVAGLAV